MGGVEGAPRGRASALSSPGRQRKGRRIEKDRRRQGNGAHRRRRHPRAQNPGALNHAIEGWGPGVSHRPCSGLISGRGRLAPSGGWPRAGVGALGKPPDALLAQPRGTSPERVRPPDGGPERVGGRVPRGPVEAEGGSLGGEKICPIRPKFREGVGKYVVKAASKTLYELLKKPVDLKRIKKYVEHCPKCTAAFLRGLFDSEACIGKDGHIKLYNTNYEVLVYAQRLLRKFGIESTGPWPRKQKEGYYYIYIRAESLLNFYRYIGFTILRKQKRLEEYLKRTGKI
jgi:hypothetical protein